MCVCVCVCVCLCLCVSVCASLNVYVKCVRRREWGVSSGVGTLPGLDMIWHWGRGEGENGVRLE